LARFLVFLGVISCSSWIISPFSNQNISANIQHHLFQEQQPAMLYTLPPPAYPQPMRVPPSLSGSRIHPYRRGPNLPFGSPIRSAKNLNLVTLIQLACPMFLMGYPEGAASSRVFRKPPFFTYRRRLIVPPLFRGTIIPFSRSQSSSRSSVVPRNDYLLVPCSIINQQSTIKNPQSTCLRLPYMRAIIHSTFSLTHPRQDEKLNFLSPYPNPFKIE
jgi:hypothetical protein